MPVHPRNLPKMERATDKRARMAVEDTKLGMMALEIAL